MPHFTRHTIAVILAILFLCLHPVGGLASQAQDEALPGGNPNSLSGFFEPNITREQAAEDLAYLYDEVMRNHAFVRPSKSGFTALYQEKLDGLASAYTELAFYRAIADLPAALQCGHSMLRPSQQLLNTLNANNAFFPLGVFVRGDTIHVTGNYYDPQIPLGSQILAINGVPAETIVDSLNAYLSSDGHNVSFKEYMLSNFFYYHYTLLLAKTRVYRVTYADPATGEPLVYEAEGRKMSQVEYGLPNQRYDTYYTFGKDYAKIVIGSFSLGQKSYQEFYAVFDAFFKAVDEKNIQTVIVDVRGNTGGDPYISAYFLRYILPVAQPYFARGTWGYADLEKTQTLLEPHFSGSLYVLMDGGCFSTTGHFLSKIKDQAFATLVGEQSGATWLATDSSIYRTLPNSSNKLKLSTHAYETYVLSEFSPDGILPDIPVVPSVDDILADRDTVYQYVLHTLLPAGVTP